MTQLVVGSIKTVTNSLSLHHMHCSLGRQNPNSGTDKTVSQAVYEVAMEAGYAGASCSDTYSSCPYTSQQIMAVVRVVLHQIEYSDEPFEQVEGGNN